jgi:uncharacterized membrane protein YqjE
MPEEDPKPDGWLDAMRRSGDSVLGLVQNRLELFSVELQEEKLRTIKLLIWLGVALALGIAAILVAAGALALFLWHLAGYLGLAGLALLTLVGAVGIVCWLRRQLHTGPTPFNATVAEFKKDRECLRKND